LEPTFLLRAKLANRECRASLRWWGLVTGRSEETQPAALVVWTAGGLP
jgi:hypothetical protein